MYYDSDDILSQVLDWVEENCEKDVESDEQLYQYMDKHEEFYLAMGNEIDWNELNK